MSPDEASLAGIQPADRVLIIGGYGVGNSGDEAILAGLLSALPAGARPVVVSAAPGHTAALHGVRAIAPPRLPAALARCDSVLIGGGGLFSSHMGARGRAIPFAGLAAGTLRKRVAIHGVSVDETTPRTLWPAVVRLFRGARGVSVRDAASAAVLARRDLSAEVRPDLSERLEAAPAEVGSAILRRAGVLPGRPVVALALAAVEPRYGMPLVAAVRALVAAFPGVQFCFVPMSHHPTNPAHDDRLLGTALQANAPALSLLEGVYHPAELMAVFGCVDAAVCMRYHAMLFAARAGTPLIGVPYAPKCAAFLAERGLPSFAPYAAELVKALDEAVCAGAQGRRRFAGAAS